MPPLERVLPWVLRAAWALLPFSVGAAASGATADASRPVQVAAAVGLWSGWALVLVATLVPHPVSLTVVRTAAPAAGAAAAGAAVAGELSPLALAGAVLVNVVAFVPETAMPFVNGPAYPNERRFLLRVPGPLLLGPLALAWALAVLAPAAGVLLIAAGRWVAGGVLLGVTAPLAVLLLRALHGLSRRWVVFVPAGIVLHDPIALADPVLFQRRAIHSLHPAPAGTDSLDLTQRALGLALELVLLEKVPMVLVRPGMRGGEAGSSARLLFVPTRPGAVLAEAAARRVPRRPPG